MTPDPQRRTESPSGGSGGTGDPAGWLWRPARPGHIPCVICRHPITLDQYRQARCWTDPGGTTCAAHAGCLRRLGETDLGLGTP